MQHEEMNVTSFSYTDLIKATALLPGVRCLYAAALVQRIVRRGSSTTYRTPRL